MKLSAVILLLLMPAFLVVCKKSAIQHDLEDIMGKWRLTETLNSPGGMGEWVPAANSTTFIEFKTDGTLENNNAFPGYDLYQFNNDSTRVILKKTSNPQTLELAYELETTNRLLLRLPCIEPCGMRFVKVH